MSFVVSLVPINLVINDLKRFLSSQLSDVKSYREAHVISADTMYGTGTQGIKDSK